MIALLGHWRLIAAGGVALAAAVSLLLLQHERQARFEAERGRDRAIAEAVAARTQGELDRTAAAAAATAQTRTVKIVTRSEEAAHAVLDLPGADQTLPQPLRDAWLAGVRGLREPEDADRSADPDGG